MPRREGTREYPRARHGAHMDDDTMGRLVSEYRVFFKEFLDNYYTTGTFVPSGRYVAAALARYVGDGRGVQRVLEVGPGTGAVTRTIVRKLGPEDRLDLVEINPNFAECLRQGLKSDPVLSTVADRTRVLELPVQQLNGETKYDVIVSGVPLNNFSVELVQEILDTLQGLLAPGGTLSFFEYIAIRYAKAMVSGRAQRQRLRGIARTIDSVLDAHQIRCDWVWWNVLPAWVHHVQLSSTDSTRRPARERRHQTAESRASEP